jgi:pimeloyl-ACP methyl ester carboxylesterase
MVSSDSLSAEYIRLINGALDPVSGRHMAERFAELVPNADIVLLEEAGHYPHVEVPERVSTLVC